MSVIAGLDNLPAFCPIVGDFYSGMEVTVPVFAKDLTGTVQDLKAAYRATYTGKLVRFVEEDTEGGFLSANAFSGRDDMEVRVCGNGDRVLLVARFDNLGKGASGAAIQNMNILLGVDETTGLVVGE
jgi:N-acetyl-gamma-glutamyl-phosphate reductase